MDPRVCGPGHWRISITPATLHLSGERECITQDQLIATRLTQQKNRRQNSLISSDYLRALQAQLRFERHLIVYKLLPDMYDELES